MGYAVRMPQLGMTMEEGVVVEWCFDEGEPFEEDDVIAVVESEKTLNDVEARTDGQFVEQFVELENPLGPGDLIAYVGDADETIPDEIREEIDAGSGAGTNETQSETADSRFADATAGTDDQARTDAAPDTSGAAADKISPRARSYARSTDGITESVLGSLDGSGPGGAVVEADVVRAVETGTLGGAGVEQTAGGVTTNTEAVSVDGRDIYDRREGSRLRNAVADRMTQSVREAPQVTLNRSVPIGGLLDLKDRLARDRGLELSVSDFLLAAVVDALEAYPEFNALYRDGVHELASNVNVGVAVDAEDGLLTPVVKGADQLSLSGLAARRTEVVQRTLSGEHTHDDLSSGTFTVTNLGHFGVDSFDPIVNPPQVAILGVGAIRDAFDPETGDARPELGLSLTFDHRPVDGADGARFLDKVVDGLTHPLRLLTLADDVDGGRTGTGKTDETTGDAASATDGEATGSFRTLADATTGERAAQATSEEGMLATVRSRSFEWEADEPEAVGGDNSAPNPVEQFLGSLASCLSLMVRNMADRRDVPVESVEVAVDGSPDHGSIEQVEVDVMVVSPAPEEDVEDVLTMAERACYVNQALDDDIERSVSLTVQQP